MPHYRVILEAVDATEENEEKEIERVISARSKPAIGSRCKIDGKQKTWRIVHVKRAREKAKKWEDHGESDGE